jgi:mRNA-degrading endonuclease RelE of RelBE toxin-antitoxin system
VAHRVELSPDAQREIRDLPAHVRAQALDLLRRLSVDPRPSRAKALRDRDGIYRLWLAKRWRIVYRVDEDPKRVLILRIRLKERIDYDTV